ncbi:MAG: Ig-like domain-containing protein [Saprospiraceae bacterium]|nr:Ig-like domain-containing protein [Saprospiraceae bacterium]
MRLLCLIALIFIVMQESAIAYAFNGADSLSNRQHKLTIPATPTIGHKSYHFAVADASPSQVEAWLNGEYMELDGMFSVDTARNSKAQMFQDAAAAVTKARQVLAEVKRIGNFVSQFDGRSLVKLPVGIDKVMNDGTQFTAAIERISLYPTHAELTVYVEVKTADMSQPLFLAAPDIVFTRRGGIHLGSLGLLGDFDIPIMEKKGYLRFKKAVIVNNDFVSGRGTFAAFDCDGLREFNIDAALAFSRDVIIPMRDSAGVFSPIPDRLVQADLEIGGTDGLNNIIASVNIPTPFAQPDKPDIIWRMNTAVFDFSEMRNDSAVRFPVADYSPDLPHEMINAWKGVYIQRFDVTLPGRMFSGSAQGAVSRTISAYDLVIDQNGFSGYVAIRPLLPLSEGNADGWAYSVDSLQVHFHRNRLVGVDFGGVVEIPLFSGSNDSIPSDTAGIMYRAEFDRLDNTYKFTIANAEERVYYSKMLRARVALAPASTLSIAYSDQNGFDIRAKLHGTLSIDSQMNGDTTSGGNGLRLRVPEVTFQGFEIGNKSPFIHKAGTWGVDSISVDMGGFNMTVSNLSLNNVPNQPGIVDLRFIGSLNLGTAANSLSADGGFRIRGEIVNGANGRQRWRYKEFKVDALFIDVNTPNVAFQGYVIFFEDIPQYGKGFQGKMSLQTKKLGETKIEAMGLFGAVNDYRYFFVDIMVRIPSETIILGGIDIRGLGGGVYVNMRQQNLNQNIPENQNNPNNTDYDPDDLASNDAYENFIRSKLGVSLSGTKYVPDSTIALGINFAVVIATSGKEEAFNANMVLNFEFARSGGLQHIRLAGYANIMAPISWEGPSCTGISIKVVMEYTSSEANNDQGGKFIAKAMVFVNMDNIKGGTTITPDMLGTTGAFSELYIGATECTQLHYAGGIDMLFSRNDWHIWVGVPGRIPNAPFPYTPISLLMDLSKGDEQAGGAARVMAQTYFNIGTSILPFPGLPPRVEQLVGLGNILQSESERASGRGFAFGMNLVVENRVNLIGILSASFILDVGFDIMLQKYQNIICVNNNDKPLGINGWYAAGQAWAYVEGNLKVLGFTVLNAALAAAIQIKGPNPTYGRGAVAGRYSVLGGLKKGQFRFPLQFGYECETEGGGTPSLEYEIISGISPINMATGVPVYQQPVVDFNYPVNKIVQLEEGGVTNSYQVQIISFEMRKNGDTLVNGQQVFSNGHYSMTFQPDEMFAPNTRYVLSVTAGLFRSGVTAPIETEVKNDTFVTGEALRQIPLDNIALAWPANGQFNYYQGENVQNLIRLKTGQDYLFPQGVAAKVRLGGVPGETPAVYNPANNTVTYDLRTLPALPGGGAYEAKLLVGETEVLTWYFRVSKYGTFADKMNAVLMGAFIATNRHDDANINGLLEPFGEEETNGISGLPDNLLSLRADLDNTLWMQQFSFMYQNTDCNFSTANIDYDLWDIKRSAIEPFPVNGVLLVQNSSNQFLVSEDNYASLHENRNDNLLQIHQITPRIRYYIRSVVREDFVKLSDLAKNMGGILDLTNFLVHEAFCGDSHSDLNTRITLSNQSLSTLYSGNSCYQQFYNFSPLVSSAVQPDPDTDPCNATPFSFVSPFSPRAINTQPSYSMNQYPVVFKYQLPNSSPSSRTFNLQYTQQ